MPVGGLKEAYLSSKPLLFITLFTFINQYITVAVAIVFIFFYRVQKYEIFFEWGNVSSCPNCSRKVFLRVGTMLDATSKACRLGCLPFQLVTP